MRIRAPSSHSSIRIRFSLSDLILAALSPFLALYLRNVPLLAPHAVIPVVSYGVVSFACSLIAFATFRIDSAIPRYFSIGDVLDLSKAVLLGDLMTSALLFTFTRLNGIPRSTSIIHALILGTGLATVRTFFRLIDRKAGTPQESRSVADEHVILIGVSDLSVFFMKFLERSADVRRKIIGILDENPQWIGRSVDGVRVFGPPAHLDGLIDEFATHGVKTDLVVIGSAAEKLSSEVLAKIRSACTRRKLEMLFLPDLLAVRPHDDTVFEVAPVREPRLAQTFRSHPVPYFRFRHFIDRLIAGILIIGWLPLLMLVAIAVFFDVGSPVIFWQRRVGLGSRYFHLYKFRTVRPSFDRKGNKVADENRVSAVGRFLRRTRLDEFPQLFNVLMGDMSLIGPRPLLAQDQPPNPTLRLTVRPGITGWAQVNGGSLLSPVDKEELDAWYVRSASPSLDLRIVGMTALSFLRGDRPSEQAILHAKHERSAVEATDTLAALVPSAAAAFGATAPDGAISVVRSS